MITKEQFKAFKDAEAFLSDAPWEVKESEESGFTIGTAGIEKGPEQHPEVVELETGERLKAWARIRNALPALIETVERFEDIVRDCAGTRTTEGWGFAAGRAKLDLAGWDTPEDSDEPPPR